MLLRIEKNGFNMMYSQKSAKLIFIFVQEHSV